MNFRRLRQICSRHPEALHPEDQEEIIRDFPKLVNIADCARILLFPGDRTPTEVNTIREYLRAVMEVMNAEEQKETSR